MPVSQPVPVLRLLGAALCNVLGHLGGLARIAWPYYLLVALCLLGGHALDGSSTLAELFGFLVGPGMASLLAGLAVLACTVQWQRHAILGEPLRGIAPLNGRVARYALWSFALGLLCALPALGAAGLGLASGLIALDPNAAEPFTVGPAGLALLAVGALLSFYLVARMVAFLPAISVDDRGLGLRRAWRLSRGHGLRLLGVVVLLALAVGLLGVVRSLLDMLADGGGPAAVAVAAAVQMATDLLSAVFGAGVTAGIYRHLVPAAG